MNRIRKLEELYLRTLRNCTFYAKEGKTNHLHNEIGCLRGIYYAAQTIGLNYDIDKDLIDIQNKKNEEDEK